MHFSDIGICTHINLVFYIKLELGPGRSIRAQVGHAVLAVETNELAGQGYMPALSKYFRRNSAGLQNLYQMSPFG